jgi:hypothetical protein
MMEEKGIERDLLGEFKHHLIMCHFYASSLFIPYFFA